MPARDRAALARLDGRRIGPGDEARSWICLRFEPWSWMRVPGCLLRSRRKLRYQSVYKPGVHLVNTVLYRPVLFIAPVTNRDFFVGVWGRCPVGRADGSGVSAVPTGRACRQTDGA
ncbi:hypothetical protein SPHINGO391_390194 [Sphingomonas aurantiaca]|uniref:Uncharacterized protein n=1 Tax=Sphingomonas aurantiaca TaxID=185949 RepID=A0A5E7YPI1_9SPHN|nr:hypothetical protein SPHINGO391_390194 [Sphingomonas aurantiaca]